MKIGIADNTALKFCKDVKEHWEKKHEVKYEIGASEHIFEWADLYYIEWYDNNLHYLFNWWKEHSKSKKPKICVRVIDWDLWVRGVRDQAIVDFVDYFICIAPSRKEWLLKEKDDATGESIQWNNKLHLIRPGVNLEKFTIKKKKTDGFQIGMVLGDMWWYKNHMGGLDIFNTLLRKSPYIFGKSKWHLHIRGQHEGGQYNPVMYNDYLRTRSLKSRVTLYPSVNDMNEWYENIDILLHPGMKEAYCYAVAEAMAKGVRPVVNHFFGAEEIWPMKILYKDHAEAVSMIMWDKGNLYEGESGRKFIENKYDVKRMLKEYDELLGT